ncbi:MAG: MFS transporter, partial [Gaiellales bacterium]
MRGKNLYTTVLIATVAASVAVAFADSSIVVLALPDLFVEFDTTVQGVSLVVTAYNVVVAAAAFAMLPLIRRISPRLLARLGLLTFLGASIGAASSSDLTTLVVFRAVQGLGAALVLVATLPLLLGLATTRAGAIGLWTSAGALGAAFGPALGGILTQAFDWRAIFVVQAPIAAAALLATVGAHGQTLPDDSPEARGPPAPAANTALGLFFGALVGALFLAVLLLVAVWSLSPIEAAAVVSAIPIATLVVRLLAPNVTPRTSVAGGSMLLALGLVALAVLPETSVAYAAAALTLCGAGLGLAVPLLSDAAIDPSHGIARSGA